MKKEKELFANLIRGYMYGTNYRVLQEMGADNKILKAFEKYQNRISDYLRKWTKRKY